MQKDLPKIIVFKKKVSAAVPPCSTGIAAVTLAFLLSAGIFYFALVPSARFSIYYLNSTGVHGALMALGALPLFYIIWLSRGLSRVLSGSFALLWWLIAFYFLEAGTGFSNSGWVFYPPLVFSSLMNFLLFGLLILLHCELVRSVHLILFRRSEPYRGIFVFFFILLFSILAVPLALLATDFLNLSSVFLYPVGSSSSYQELFWIFGHPVVYFMVLPILVYALFYAVTVGIASRGFVSFWRTSVFIVSVIIFISFLVWGHHLFTSPFSYKTSLLFSVTSTTIAVPMIFAASFIWFSVSRAGRCASFSKRLDRIVMELSIIGFFVGGLTGIFVTLVDYDVVFHDTRFIVAHFHLFFVVFVGSVFFILLFKAKPRGTSAGFSLGRVLLASKATPATIGFLLFLPILLFGEGVFNRRDGDLSLVFFETIALSFSQALLVDLYFIAIVVFLFVRSTFGRYRIVRSDFLRNRSSFVPLSYIFGLCRGDKSAVPLLEDRGDLVLGRPMPLGKSTTPYRCAAHARTFRPEDYRTGTIGMDRYMAVLTGKQELSPEEIYSPLGSVFHSRLFATKLNADCAKAGSSGRRQWLVDARLELSDFLSHYPGISLLPSFEYLFLAFQAAPESLASANMYLTLFFVLTTACTDAPYYPLLRLSCEASRAVKLARESGIFWSGSDVADFVVRYIRDTFRMLQDFRPWFLPAIYDLGLLGELPDLRARLFSLTHRVSELSECRNRDADLRRALYELLDVATRVILVSEVQIEPSIPISRLTIFGPCDDRDLISSRHSRLYRNLEYRKLGRSITFSEATRELRCC